MLKCLHIWKNLRNFVVEKRKEHVKRKSNDYEKGFEHH